KMQLWKQIEEYLGVPSTNLMDLLLDGRVPVSFRNSPVEEFLKDGDWSGVRGLRQMVAKAVNLNCNQVERRIALTDSATDACQLLIRGLESEFEGKSLTILSTDMEYDTIATELEHYKDRQQCSRYEVKLFGENNTWRGHDVIIRDFVERVTRALENNGVCLC